MKMMTIEVQTPNLPKDGTFEQLAKSMTLKAFDHISSVKAATLILGKSQDARVQFKAQVVLTLANNQQLQSEASSIHHLTAFTQALSRMERQIIAENKRTEHIEILGSASRA